MFEEIEEVWYKHKIILVGESGIGKSSIIKRYIMKKFDLSSPPTIGSDFAIKNEEF